MRRLGGWGEYRGRRFLSKEGGFSQETTGANQKNNEDTNWSASGNRDVSGEAGQSSADETPWENQFPFSDARDITDEEIQGENDGRERGADGMNFGPNKSPCNYARVSEKERRGEGDFVINIAPEGVSSGAINMERQDGKNDGQRVKGWSDPMWTTKTGPGVGGRRGAHGCGV